MTDRAYESGCLDAYLYVHKLLGDESHEFIEDHVTEALEAARQAGADEVVQRVLDAFSRPPVWGPNENGDLMLDMSLDGFLTDLRYALEGTKPSGRSSRA